MDHRHAGEIGGPGEARQPIRRRDGEEGLRQQSLQFEARPVAASEADRAVDIAVIEVDQLRARHEADLGFGIVARETAEPRHEPAGREGGRDQDRQQAAPRIVERRERVDQGVKAP